MKKLLLGVLLLSWGFSTSAGAGPAKVEPIPNSGFEDGLQNWRPSPGDAAENLSQVLADAAYSGQNGLRIKQAMGAGAGKGSWIYSGRVPIESGKNYRLSFWARRNEESGVGVWVTFLDAQGKPISLPTQTAVQLPKAVGPWTEQHLDFHSPEVAVALTIAYTRTPILPATPTSMISPLRLPN